MTCKAKNVAWIPVEKSKHVFSLNKKHKYQKQLHFASENVQPWRVPLKQYGKHCVHSPQRDWGQLPSVHRCCVGTGLVETCPGTWWILEIAYTELMHDMEIWYNTKWTILLLFWEGHPNQIIPTNWEKHCGAVKSNASCVCSFPWWPTFVGFSSPECKMTCPSSTTVPAPSVFSACETW